MLRLVGVAALGALAACGSVSAQKLPVFGEQLYVKAVMQLPYAGIIEPIESYYDGKSGNMRVDYYGGLDTYIFRTDLNVTWQVNPVSMDGLPSTRCFATAGPPNIRSFLPDLTGFELQTDATQVNQQICDNWQLQVNTLGKVSTYNFFVSRTTGQAVRYQMMGYDSLIGSHFDLYQLDYTNLTNVASFPAGIFDQPSGKQCGSFPGPGATHMNPLDEMDGYFPGDIEEEELLSPEYKDYLAAHGKTAAADGKEVRLREIQFKKHSHFIAAHQRQVRMGKASYSVGLNFLADHLPAELNARRGKLPSGMGGRKTNDAAEYHQRQFSDADLPTSIDWREKGAVNPPQDQGICGSCWSFGSTAAIESAYFLKYGKLKVFAEQELMDCSWGEGNNACDGGEDFRAYNWIMKNGGISFKENYGPYLMADGYCSAGVLIPDASIHHYVNVTQQDEVALMDAIASQGPLSVSIDASHPGLSFYTGGVYDDPACGNQPDDLDHSVSAVGYGTENGQDYWIVKNNWSTYWGLDGYIKMARKNNNCGVATMPTYVVLN